MFGEAVEEGRLRGVHFPARLIQREPVRTAGFWDLQPFAASRRPLDLAKVGNKPCWVELALARPGGNNFPALLDDLAQGLKFANGFHSGFLAELANGGGKRLLSRLILALRNGPNARNLPRPEWAAGMHEKHARLAGGELVEEDAGAAFHDFSQKRKQRPQPLNSSTEALPGKQQ